LFRYSIKEYFIFDSNRNLQFMQKYLTTCVIALITLFSFAQQTAVFTNDFVEYQQALELYNNKQYLAAQAIFSKVKRTADDETIKGDCMYYIANCAVRLNQQGADGLMEDFVTQYPTSIKRNSAFLDVANYYFANAKYSYARKWYDKVDEGSIGNSQLNQYYFNNGYAYFKNKRYNEAKKYFNKVENTSVYGSQANYYLGYIAYENDDYNEANDRFDEVKDDEQYAGDLSYYQADMNFKLGDFQKAIDLGKEQFDSSSSRERSELSKIIGESYFNLEKYEEAIPYLKEYKGKRGRWNNTDYYQLGYAYYKQNDFESAISEFNKIIDGENDVAQNAYYHLAKSYLEVNKKQQALNAFKNASEMNFSEEIKEDAWLNYAKISYEIGNSYQSVPQVLTSYLDAYPKTDNKTEIESLLIDSYITSKNYKEALVLLEKNKSFEHKLAYQKVAFYRGIELYNESDYKEAMSYFNKSLKEPRDASFTARATYWKAECDYLLTNFSEALIGFKQFLQLPENESTSEATNINYNVGYTYFKLKEYEQAIQIFQDFVVNSSDNQRSNDAYLRLGDSYFVTSKYWPAMENYNKAIDGGVSDSDYAEFQKAISYGFVDRSAQKIEALQSFVNKYNKSVYRDDALYELGNTYLAQNNTEKAILTYDRLLTETPRSSYISKSLLKKALIYDNTNRTQNALNLFKRVANEFPSTPEALQAVSSAKIIYIDLGQVDEYAQWVSTLDFVEIADSELDDASYQAAENQFLANKTTQAITRFEKYLSDFPNGRHALQANFYLAQLYFANDEFSRTISLYTFVVDKQRNEFTEQALARLSQVYLEENDYNNAKKYLVRLEIEADFPQNIIFAQSNIMKTSYELEQYAEAVIYAEKVLENTKIDNNVKSDAQVIIARSAMKTGDEGRAKTAYEEVSKIATGILAAEALYFEAYFNNKEGLYEASNIVVQKLAKDFSGYKLFGSKGLVLMAKNFYALDDAYQATYILESVIQNFTDFPEVVEEAQTELSKIKEAEAKTNSSVETDDKN